MLTSRAQANQIRRLYELLHAPEPLPPYVVSAADHVRHRTTHI